MTIASQTSRISYNGDGSTTAFAVPFVFQVNADLVVYLQDANGNQTVQSLGTNYTLSGAGASSGGTCTFITAPASGNLVTVYRDPPVTQTTSYNNNDPFPAKSHENALDKLTMLIQRIRDLVGRAIRLPDGEGNTSTILASIATRKNRLFGFGTNGELIYPLGPNFVSNQWIGVASLDTLSTAQVTSFLGSVNIVKTSGYAAIGDGGEATYKRVGSQPSHAGKFQSADGTWWEISEPIIDARMLGVTSGSNCDTTMANAIAVAAAVGSPLRIPAGTYIFAAEVNISALVGSKITLGGAVIFDFTGATNAALFPDSAHVYVGGAALAALISLGLDVSASDNLLRFSSSSHGVLADDRLGIYSSSVLFNGSNSHYYAGEWCRAMAVSGTDVTTYAGTYAAYTKTSVALYKHPNKPIYIEGGTITIKESTASGFDIIAGFRADRIVDSDFSMMRPTQSLYAGIVLHQCINIFGSGYSTIQRDTAGGDSYGLIFAGSQDCNRIEGYFYGGRHGVAMGGFAGVGDVPNRNNYTFGTHQNSKNSGAGIGAWNAHGNSEYCGGEGTFDGGITAGGDHMRFRGRIRVNDLKSAWAIFIVDNLGFNFDFEGMQISGVGDPTSAFNVGVVDCCAQSTSGNTIYTTRGGRINLSNVKFNCPNAGAIFSMGNQGYTTTEKISLSLEGASWAKTDFGSAHVIVTLKHSGSRVLDKLYLNGFENGPAAGYSMDSLPLVAGWRLGGTFTINPSTSATSTSISTTWPIPAPKTPVVNVWLPAGSVGADAVIGFSGSPTATGASLGILNAKGNNFSTSAAQTVAYSAQLDEC